MKNYMRNDGQPRKHCYVLYNADDIWELPVAYFDTLEEVANYFGKTKNAISSQIYKHANNYFQTPFIRHKGKKYELKRYETRSIL